VLCTTSTLAQGVNLPAYLVILKGIGANVQFSCALILVLIVNLLKSSIVILASYLIRAIIRMHVFLYQLAKFLD